MKNLDLSSESMEAAGFRRALSFDEKRMLKAEEQRASALAREARAIGHPVEQPKEEEQS